MLGALARLYHRLRFKRWTAITRLRLRRHGITLEVDAPHPVHAFTMPAVEVIVTGRGGSLRLALGRDCRLGRGTIIEIRTGTDNVLTLADRVTFESYARVQLEGGTIHLGDDVQLRDFANVKTTATLRLGRKAIVGRYSTVHAAADMHLDEQVGIGERSTVIDSDHPHDGTGRYFYDNPVAVTPIVFGRNVFVAANCVILRGSKIGENCVVAAGTVVTGGEFPAGHLIAGAPAEAKRKL